MVIDASMVTPALIILKQGQKMRTFAYCRVSTIEQTTENQIEELRRLGYDVRADRVISETISGGVPAFERPEFKNLINKLESGDRLAVLKLDRLGRDNIDVQQTIEKLINMGVSVVCTDLPVKDLSSSEGRLMLQLIASFAEFEKSRIRERTIAGLERAKADGKKLGRPVGAHETLKRVQRFKAMQMSQSEVVRETGLSLATVKRHWNAPKASDSE